MKNLNPLKWMFVMTVPWQTSRMTYREWLELQTLIWNQQRIMAGAEFEITAPERPMRELHRTDPIEVWILSDELEVDEPMDELIHGYSLYEPMAVFNGFGIDAPTDTVELDEDERDELVYEQIADELEAELNDLIRTYRSRPSSCDVQHPEPKLMRGKRSTAHGLRPEELKTAVGCPLHKERRQPAKPHLPEPDEGTKRDVDRLGRLFRLLNAEQKRDVCEHIAHLAGGGLTTEAVLANASTIVTTLLMDSKARTHQVLDNMRRAAGRPDLTPAERQQGFAEHDKLKERLAAIIAKASRCRYAEMSVSELVRLAIADSAKEAEIRRELIAFGTSAANSGTRKREALALFHRFDTELRAEHVRRTVDTSGELKVDSSDHYLYQGTVPDDGIEL